MRKPKVSNFHVGVASGRTELTRIVQDSHTDVDELVGLGRVVESVPSTFELERAGGRRGVLGEEQVYRDVVQAENREMPFIEWQVSQSDRTGTQASDLCHREMSSSVPSSILSGMILTTSLQPTPVEDPWTLVE